jgi:hypothetical protein
MWEQGQGNGFRLGHGPAWLCALGLMALALGAGGCGRDRSPVAVRVGERTISEQAVAHWTRVIATGSRLEGFDPGGRGGPREQALQLLIAAAWLYEEALAQGVGPSSQAVERVLEERREANGASEFEQSLRASHQTASDVRLEIEAELAAAAIRREVLSRVPAVGEPEILAYYTTHRAMFRIPEKRTVDLLENLRSPEAAHALVERIGIGASFARAAFHEQLELHSGSRVEPDIKRVTQAIFAANVGVPSRPLRLNGHWTVFVVRKISPATFKPLRAARAQIVTRLTADRRSQALAAFSSAYRARWTARTSCHPRYIVHNCARYAVPAQPQPAPLTAGG